MSDPAFIVIATENIKLLSIQSLEQRIQMIYNTCVGVTVKTAFQPKLIHWLLAMQVTHTYIQYSALLIFEKRCLLLLKTLLWRVWEN